MTGPSRRALTPRRTNRQRTRCWLRVCSGPRSGSGASDRGDLAGAIRPLRASCTGDPAVAWRILVVESGPAIAAGLPAALADEGYASASQSTLVLPDRLMPGRAGPAVCRRLQSDPRTARVPA